ncbi:hypothetical protein BGZ54_006317 [Gamsiella multidivaricata]|nr:hypothetical protein BGZ54_006317 [Gamsiella multidivaricata]
MAHVPLNITDPNDTPQLHSSLETPLQQEPIDSIVGTHKNDSTMASGSLDNAMTLSSKRAMPNQPLRYDRDLEQDTSAHNPSALQTGTEDTAASSLPLPISSTLLPRNAVGAAAGEGTQSVSFSPLPAGRPFSESYPARRTNEFTPSPARSLVQVLEAAEVAQAMQRHGGRGDPSPADQDMDTHWETHASVGTGISAVHFQPQRTHHHGHRGRTGSGMGWMGTSAPESRFSEFEVVYDDGIRKQRTFSLTTELDNDDDSDDSDGSESSPLLEYQGSQARYGQDLHSIHMHDGGNGSDPTPLAHSASSSGKLPFHQPQSAASNGRYLPGSSRSNNPFAYLITAILTAFHHIAHFRLSLPNRRILKASIAYLLGCLVSFTPFFLPYIGTSGHLAATSAVFFNPAKSLGRMVDAVTAGLSAIAFGFLVSLGSMASALWFNSRNMYIWGHVVSVVVFGGGSTFIIAYAKAYFNRPTVNVGKSELSCTLSHIAILVTLTKEGAMSLADFNLTRVLAITTSMLLGVVISTVVSIFLWPESAHEKLRQDMGKSLSSFRLLLKLLTKTFLLEADTTPFGSESVQKLIETQVKSFSALAKSLEEAQLEFPGSGISKYEDCVKSLNTLAQYLNGLRSSCGLQYDMLKRDEQRKGGDSHNQPGQATAGNGAAAPRSGAAGRRALGMGMRMPSYSLIGSLTSDQEQNTSAELIDFLDHVGKPMKSLALTCKLTIEHLQEIFTSTDVARPTDLERFGSRSKAYQTHTGQSGYDSTGMISDSVFDVGTSRVHHGSLHDSSKRNPSFENMQHNLAKALDIFEAANSKALKRFYSHQHRRRSENFQRPIGITKHTSEPSLFDIASGTAGSATDTGIGMGFGAGIDGELSAEKAPIGEQIFLVYFFVFNLMEFSRELSQLVSCVEILVDGDEGLLLWIERNRQSWWRRVWFNLTGFPRRLRRHPAESNPVDSFDDPETSHDPPNSDPSHHPGHGSIPHNASDHQQYNSHGSTRFRRRRKERLFPKPNIHNKANTLQTPVPSTFTQRWSTRLWKFLHLFRSFQVKYAVKAAFSTIVLLIPAFVDLTRPYFVQYRGEWALISMLIVMVPTVGGTNIVGIYRIMGTVVGCYIGVAVYPRIGQVTLLAFNLVLLQTYNRKNDDGTVPPDEDDEDDDMPGFPSPSAILRRMGSLTMNRPHDPTHVDIVWTIAFHRAVAVSIGVVTGVLITSYIWPYEARVELRKGLSDLLLNISWLYNRLVSVYSTNLDRERFQEPNEEQQDAAGNSNDMDIERMNKEFMAIELSLQLQLLRLYALLEETPNEPRLKGKFPIGTYKNMLGSCQNILDRFLSMRLVITKDEWLESARRDFIVPVNRERREMVGNVLLYFYTIASALRLKTPLPPYLPPANNARLRLIQKIRQLPVVQNKVVMTEDNDDRYIFYYAYALVMEDVIRELERLGRWSQDLFGVITPAAEFEAWFTNDGVAPLILPSPDLPSSATREAPQSPYHDVDQPYQYPTLQRHERPVMSPEQQEQGQSPSRQQPGLSPRKYHHADEHSGLLDSGAQSTSNYRSVGNSVNEREDMFYLDFHDPFRDSNPISMGEDADGDKHMDTTASFRGQALSQKSGRRIQNSHSLNSTTSASRDQRHQGSQGGQSRRSQGSQDSQGYGAISRDPSGSGTAGSRSRKTSTHSSWSSSQGTSVVGGLEIQPAGSNGNGGRPERPLTASISATRLGYEPNILRQPLVQEPQQQQQQSVGRRVASGSNSVSHASSEERIADLERPIQEDE